MSLHILVTKRSLGLHLYSFLRTKISVTVTVVDICKHLCRMSSSSLKDMFLNLMHFITAVTINTCSRGWDNVFDL